MEKIILDDVFIALDKIYKDLPKKKIINKDVNNISYGDIIESPLNIPSNVPPYNQASMDGIGVKIKRKDYFIKGKTYLDKLNKVKIKDNECLIVKTGSLISNEVKFVIPVERLFKKKNIYYALDYQFKNKFIRNKGHIFQKNQKVNLNTNYLSLKDFVTVKSINKLKVKIKPRLKFNIISTGSEFTSKHFINPTNSEYLSNIIEKYGQTVDKKIHIKDNQKLILKEINKSKSDITVIIGGTGKSEDDINFESFKLKINGLDLKPGRPFKFFSKSKRIYLFFPGNPCSSFVLTNILIKLLINRYCFNKYNLEEKIMDIKEIKYNFTKLTRKSFLFAIMKNKKISIIKNQESSNLSNLLSSNCLAYYDKTKKIKIFKLND